MHNYCSGLSSHMYDRLGGSTCTCFCPSCGLPSFSSFWSDSSVVRCQELFLGLEIETWVFRSRDYEDLGHQVSRSGEKKNSSLETMVSRSQHWLHQFQLETEHSLKGGTNYGNRATDVGTKHAVFRPRPRPWTSGLKTKAETWAIRPIRS